MESDSPQGQTYTDPRFGFRVSVPTGWAIHADERNIHIQSPDRELFVQVVPFRGEADGAGDDTNTVLQILRLPAAFPDLFGQVRMERIDFPVPPDRDLIGTFRYQDGAGQARVLGSRHPQGTGGLLFVIGAPVARFEAEHPVLLQILGTLVFGGNPVRTENATISGGSEIAWQRWSDPREGAFHIEVPQGWAVEGGAFRFGITDVRPSFQLRSPDGEIVIQSGDPGLPLFTVPNQMMMQMGIQEGQVYSPTGTFQTMAARYMPPRVFGRWYLERFLGAEVEGVMVTAERDLPDAGQQQTLALRQKGLPMQVEVARIDFSGRSRRNGKPIQGQLLVTITGMGQSPMGFEAWTARPLWSIVSETRSEMETRKSLVAAVVPHLVQSWRDDPEWTARNNQQQAQVNQQLVQNNRQQAEISRQMHENSMNQIRQAGDRSRQMAQESDARHQALMDNFHQRNAAQDNAHRQFVNYVSDQTDVRDPNSGQSWKVGSGYQNYYHNDRTDTILGTDAPSSPGIDWTPLKEF